MKTSGLWLYRLITVLMPETRFFEFKVWLLRWCGAAIGENVRICSSVVILGNGKLTIGDDVWIGHGCMLIANGVAEIKIGSYVDIAPQVLMTTGSHKIDSFGNHIAGQGIGEDINVGDGAWIGMRACILPGVSIGKKSVVAAGAVVTKSCDGMSLVAGCPAQFKKRIGE